MKRAPFSPCLAAALAFAVACAAGQGLAQEGQATPGEIAQPMVDVFPAQSWASLGAEPAPAAAPAPVEAPEPEAPALDAPIEPERTVQAPFEVTGEWRENSRRVVVLEGMQQVFLLCEASCDVRDAVLPGREIANGYRLKSLGPKGAVIVAEDKTEFELLAPGQNP
ncbi:MAG: hypothetical protein P4L92_06775 [Rudaea sp.]|nr:hypothetical protein [Rudaea sp.]